MLACIHTAEVFNNKTLISSEQRGAALLLIALWPAGKGQEENKNFLRGPLKKWDIFIVVVQEVVAILAVLLAV